MLGYCLMTNHVHWVAIPDRADSLAVLFQRVHGRYAQYWNARRRRTGHLWQNRFFSCAVAAERLAIVLRYVEANPIRAGMVERAEAYRWSSAAAHLAGPGHEAIPLLDWDYWSSQGGATWWQQWILAEESHRDVVDVRRATYAGAPYGAERFVADMEQTFGRQWRQRGRPPRRPAAAENSEKGTEPSASVAAASG